ncbi:MAG: hypothetical protein AAF297_10905 [Planctomycetota bacterium]
MPTAGTVRTSLHTPVVRVTAAAVALALALFALPACGTPPTKAENRLASTAFPVDLAPNLTRRVYSPRTESSADVYLTDLSPQALTRALSDPADPTTGTIVHVHLFIRPQPGRTPIEETALSATIRYVILARGQAGVYDGGGFLLPEGKPGGDRFEGTMLDASVRLSAATPGFIDRIGRGSLELDFRAERDEPASELIRRVADRFAFRAIQTSRETDTPDDLPGDTTDDPQGE